MRTVRTVPILPTGVFLKETNVMKLSPALTMGLTLLVFGCSRDGGTDVAPDLGDAAENALEADQALAEIAGQVMWTKGNRTASVDLREVAPEDLPTAVAATVMVPGVEEVQLKGRAVDDTIALPVSGIPTLRRLRLTDTDVTDTTLKKIGEVGNLQLLHVHGAQQITAEGLRSLSELSELKDLSLSGDNIDDGVIASLAGLTELKKVRLRGTAITGDNIAPIGDTPIEDLELAETDFGNAGMADVAEMPELTKLNLWLTKIDDQGLQSLAGNERLTSLNLDNLPGITDASIDVIASMPSLTFLHLGKTAVTADGVERLDKLQKLEKIHVTNLDVPEEVLQRLRDRIPSLKEVVN